MNGPVHLNALRAFEASARHQSFSAAAAELNVTPAAVGQLVRTLEDWLGAPLFHRSSSGRVRLVPTEAAERALPEIRAGFDRLVVGLEKLKEGSVSGVLTVTVSPAFAATVNDALAQSLQLLALLEEQAGLVGRSAMAGQLFLRNCERLQSLLDASPALTALGGFWRELRQQRGGHMAELTQLIQCLRTALEHFRVEMIWRLREQAPAVKA